MIQPELAPAPADLPNLIVRCVASDPEAWDEFVSRYHSRIVLYAARASRFERHEGAELCAELVQDVYLRLLAHDRRALRAWRGETEQSLSSYLATIVHAVACDALKRRRSRKRTARVVSLDAAGPCEEPTLAEMLAAPQSASPDYAFGERLAPDALRALLARVERGPQAKRNSLIFMLHVLDGLTASEISRLPGFAMSIANVESALRRTKERLRETLAERAAL